MLIDPREAGAKPPFPQKKQPVPGRQAAMDPPSDCGETSYRGSGRLAGRKALITGGDSGIGRAVAIAFAREGADVVISYLDETEDAASTAALVRDAGRKCIAIAGDIREEAHCQSLVRTTIDELGGIDILVNNAAYQMTRQSIVDVPSEEFDRIFRTNVYATFFLCKAAVPHLPPGSSIINTVSVNSDKPSPHLVAYAATKGALQNLTGGLSQSLASQGIRVNCVAPGPIWTPLIPATMEQEEVTNFGKQVPLERPGQPVEVAPAYVMLASGEASFISGATIAVTGGVPMI
ncbi:SDR family oxidoreductase [Xylophilus sp. GOD-11R]|uniref:SDR family oxidoreductase n=1 Tax=Xylophilus sp. GOD-11R TaxID=3089814 RepID=UPI00298C95D0|nr:SDR family oxidoreductase [Xylophilus sp. GOD-11R]WPB55589.1 SDR family oxidoreductase [Xylophilus sp. GOD-11R]